MHFVLKRKFLLEQTSMAQFQAVSVKVKSIHLFILWSIISGCCRTAASCGKPEPVMQAIRAALEAAILAEQSICSLQFKSHKKRAAWADCCDLYASTVLSLNRTATGGASDWAETQTLLSAALTNLDTCRHGFWELGATANALPSISHNVSDLIRTALALNGNRRKVHNATGAGGPSGDGEKEGFPAWVRPGLRRHLQACPSEAVRWEANVTVAQDGTGDYETVNGAIKAAAAAANRSASERFVIYIKAGTYNEYVEIEPRVKMIVLVGDGINKTIISGYKNVTDGGNVTTYQSATFAVTGDDSVVQGITFKNTAGDANPQARQAVAVRCMADRVVFYKCSFEGHQDTLYVHSFRQFYRQCAIYGTVDFIFGNAAAVFQNCKIIARNPPGKTNVITAQSRFNADMNTGISIQRSTVEAAPDLASDADTYLGRPWKNCSRTIFMATYLGSLIDPAGWLTWDGEPVPENLYYAEYNNTGPGSSTAERVNWTGFHALTNASDALPFTVGRFLPGDWLRATRIPYIDGL